MFYFRLLCSVGDTMEALQRLHMSPVGSPFGMSHHESMLRTNASVASHDDRKSPMDTRLIMQVSKYIFLRYLYKCFRKKDLCCAKLIFCFLVKSTDLMAKAVTKIFYAESSI